MIPLLMLYLLLITVIASQPTQNQDANAARYQIKYMKE